MRRVHGTSHIQMRGVAIAVIAAAGAAALSGSCFLDTETSLCAASGRRCAPGQVCAAHQDACIPIGGCGDGIVSTLRGEVCDDGNILGGDRCSADCGSEEICGDGTIDSAAGETCDDGNQAPGDGCNAECKAEVCGNHVVDVQFGEVCDDGNARSSDGCSADCKSTEVCGNGVIDNDGPGGVLREECEFTTVRFPSPIPDTAQCDSDCTLPRCGDGHFNPEYVIPGKGYREQCDPGAVDTAACDHDCTFVRCGDGYRNTAVVEGRPVEPCDYGVLNSNTTPDACRTDCRTAFCGDGVTDSGEMCDDHNEVNADFCTNRPGSPGRVCQPAVCGDGFVRSATDPRVPEYTDPEECDDGAADFDGDGKVNDDAKPDACRTSCRKAFCGDGVIDPGEGETCDPGDGNRPQVGCMARARCVNNCTACS